MAVKKLYKVPLENENIPNAWAYMQLSGSELDKYPGATLHKEETEDEKRARTIARLKREYKDVSVDRDGNILALDGKLIKTFTPDGAMRSITIPTNQYVDVQNYKTSRKSTGRKSTPKDQFKQRTHFDEATGRLWDVGGSNVKDITPKGGLPQNYGEVRDRQQQGGGFTLGPAGPIITGLLDKFQMDSLLDEPLGLNAVLSELDKNKEQMNKQEGDEYNKIVSEYETVKKGDHYTPTEEPNVMEQIKERAEDLYYDFNSRMMQVQAAVDNENQVPEKQYLSNGQRVYVKNGEIKLWPGSENDSENIQKLTELYMADDMPYAEATKKARYEVLKASEDEVPDQFKYEEPKLEVPEFNIPPDVLERLQLKYGIKLGLPTVEDKPTEEQLRTLAKIYLMEGYKSYAEYCYEVGVRLGYFE